MFYAEYPLSNLTPAPYNPRHLEDEAFLALQRSIRTLGMIKPVIATSDGRILAGHQRQKAALAIGLETSPVYVVDGIDPVSEMRFNQLHNGTDLDTGDEHVTVPPCAHLGYHDVPSSSIKGTHRATGGTLRVAIADLLTRFGNWGGIVANQKGECLSGAQYALSCRQIGMPCRVYYVSDEQTSLVRGLFRRPYGEFDYSKLPKATYMQTFAQLHRVREDEEGRPVGVRAPFYDHVYIPNFKPGERILDFGCGQADYVRLLQKDGVRIWGMEFYFRAGRGLNTTAIHAMAASLFETLKTQGRFDTVICEFVLNSTDRNAAEAAVMTCLNAFCKPGGYIYASGRTRASTERELTNTADTQASLSFLDRDGYSALAQQGRWLYQKYHTKSQATDLAHTYIGPNATYGELSGMETCFLIHGRKEVELPADVVEAALDYEFNLQWPDGHTVNRHREAKDAWHAALELER